MSRLNDWAVQIEDDIFTILKTRANSNLVTTYSEINFTRSSRLPVSETHFPTIVIEFIGNSEMGSTLDGQSVNAIDLTIEVRVIVKKNDMAILRECISEMADQIKKLRFYISSTTRIDNETDDTIHAVIRANRVIGANDNILL